MQRAFAYLHKSPGEQQKRLHAFVNSFNEALGLRFLQVVGGPGIGLILQSATNAAHQFGNTLACSGGPPAHVCQQARQQEGVLFALVC